MRTARRLGILAAALTALMPAANAQAVTDELMTTFSPTTHGYHFPNSFTADVKVDLGSLGTFNLARFGYGLCGGIAYGAADNFYAGIPAPPDTETPPKGSQLRRYLFQRQKTSLLSDNALIFRRFLAWQLLPVKSRKVAGQTVVEGLNTKTGRYVKKVRKAVAENRPVPLGLVEVDGTGPPQQNHQLLAIGYFKADNGEKVVVVWDGNYFAGIDEDQDGDTSDPEDVDGITYLYTKRRVQTVDKAGTQRVAEGPNNQAERWRGFFTTPYSAVKPAYAP